MAHVRFTPERTCAVRARAAAMIDPINKATLLRIAEDYEDLGLSAQLVVGKPPSTQKRILMEAKILKLF